MTGRRGALRLSLVAAALLASAADAAGQFRSHTSWPDAGSPPPASPRSVWQAPLASAVVPGSGQFLLGQRRGWAYLGLEAVVWTGFLVERSRGLDDRGAYRDLAWEEARGGLGARVDGDFPYYERMSQWERSGSFDRDPVQPGIQPELDPATFNGDAWRLASAIFLGGQPAEPGAPGYASALAFYQERAYGEAFLWDWSGRMESLERFRRLMERSDDHLRSASLILGGAVVNRIASGLDAFFSQRTGTDASLRVLPRRSPAPGGGLLPHLILRVIVP